MIDAFAAALRFAFRSFRKQPGFTAIAALVMALGVAAFTVMYATLEAVVVRPLPFDRPERLVWAWSLTPASQQNTVSALDYLDYRAAWDSFAALASYFALPATVVLTGGGDPERAPQTLVSHNFFAALGAMPALGRFFLPAEERPGAPHVAVIGHALWQRRFGARADAVGAALTIDGRVYEIVGVAPAGFDFPAGVALWLPMRHDQPVAQGRGNRNFRVFGRLAAGVTLEQAQTEARLVAARIAAANPAEDEGWGVQLQPMHEVFFGSYRAALLALLGAVTLLLLIACANVSSLLLARALARRHEIAVRLVLGASRARVVGQLLIEGLALAALGGAFGLALSHLGIEALKALAPPALPRVAEVGLDPKVMAVALAASVLAGLLLAVAPACHSGAFSLADALRQGAHASAERAGLRLRSALVVAQVALSAALLVGAGLLARSLARLYEVDPGFDPEALLLTEVQLPSQRYDTAEKRVALLSEARERLATLPGVVDAGGAELVPFTLSERRNVVYRSDRPPQSSEQEISARRQIVTRGYFQTLGIPLLRGRFFESTDGSAAPPVTVVNQALADLFWPGEEAIGKTLVLTWGDGIPMTIVGVAGNVRQNGPADALLPAFYIAYEQFPVLSDVRLMIRARGDSAAIATDVREVFRSLDPSLALARFDTMSSLFADRVALPRLRAWLLSLFSALALVLAVTGLYAVLAYFVSQRSHELGIRMALGADAICLTRLVVGRGMTLAGLGIALGLPGGLAGARLARSLLYQTAPLDPAILVVVALALGLGALAACLVPALRATRVDPLAALRAE